MNRNIDRNSNRISRRKNRNYLKWVKKVEPLRAVLSPAKFFYDLEVIQNHIDFCHFSRVLIEISLK